MKSLVIANQKGGVGKTALLVHLAFNLIAQGKKVVIIDLDTQGNASFSLEKYISGVTASQIFLGSAAVVESAIALIASDQKLADIEKLSIAEAAIAFKSYLQKIAHSYDVCLIDTGPALSVSMVSSLLSADFVLSPIELESYSLQGIQRMLTTIQGIKSKNSGLIFLGMVPSKVDNRNPRHKRHLAELLSAYPQMMIPHSIGLRSSISDALATKRPVSEIKKTAARVAAKEIQQFADYVFGKMKVS